MAAPGQRGFGRILNGRLQKLPRLHIGRIQLHGLLVLVDGLVHAPFSLQANPQFAVVLGRLWLQFHRLLQAEERLVRASF